MNFEFNFFLLNIDLNIVCRPKQALFVRRKKNAQNQINEAIVKKKFD